MPVTLLLDIGMDSVMLMYKSRLKNKYFLFYCVIDKPSEAASLIISVVELSTWTLDTDADFFLATEVFGSRVS
jgi:hypothetical protein